MPKPLVRDEARALVRHGRDAALTTASLTAAVWTVTLADWLLGGAVSAWSVAPRTLMGLLGIGVMPFVHAGVFHLLANTLAAIPLLFLAAERRVMDVWVVVMFTALTSGLGAWLFGAAGSLHVGASGVVFGLMGFVLGRGWFERRPVALGLAALTLVLYGGSLITMLPLFAGISWQAHLFGFLGGLLVSATLGRALKRG